MTLLLINKTIIKNKNLHKEIINSISPKNPTLTNFNLKIITENLLKNNLIKTLIKINKKIQTINIITIK